MMHPVPITMSALALSGLFMVSAGCTSKNPSYLIDVGTSMDSGVERRSSPELTIRLDGDAPPDGARDGQAIRDLGRPDRARHDLPSQDLRRADSAPLDGMASDSRVRDSHPPDRGADGRPHEGGNVAKPFSPSQLKQALKGISVPCVMADGSTQGKPIDVIDRDEVVFRDDANLSSWDKAVRKWVGASSAVVVVVDPNACEKEDPVSGDKDWKSAGIVIRKASLKNGDLLLEPSVTHSDMNIVEASFSDAEDVAERFDSDDSGLPPQLVGTFRAIRNAILNLAR